MTEYGDPANATDFPYLRAVSPLQNVAVPSGSGQYPATMITTGARCTRTTALMTLMSNLLMISSNYLMISCCLSTVTPALLFQCPDTSEGMCQRTAMTA